MDKPIYQSKTLWGFGIAAIIGLSQAFGVVADENVIAATIQILSALFGAYGLRDASTRNLE